MQIFGPLACDDARTLEVRDFFPRSAVCKRCYLLGWPPLQGASSKKVQENPRERKKDFLTLNVSGEFNLENFSKVSVIKRSAVKNST